jgi:uncharacterized membrane protein
MLRKFGSIRYRTTEMGQFAVQVSQALRVKLPEDYAGFMDTYGKRLPADPVREESWIRGLGSPEFVVGTTLAFRSMLPGFRLEYVVIGYFGAKTITINKMYEEIDEYVMLDTSDGSVLAVDARGVRNRIATSFEEWITPELLRATLREKYTSNLTVVVFDDELKAEEARVKLRKIQREGFIELEDAVVVVKEQNGTARYHQMRRPARKGGLTGSITGLIVGSIFFSPLLGAVFGAVTGAVSAALTDMGIDDRFMKDLSRKFKPGCSALFALVRKTDPERVREVFLGFGGRVMVNSVSKEREAAIQAFLDGTREGAE